MAAHKNLVPCPECRFSNFPEAEQCLFCKTPIRRATTEMGRVESQEGEDTDVLTSPFAKAKQAPAEQVERLGQTAKFTRDDVGVPELMDAMPEYRVVELDPKDIRAWVCCSPLPPIPISKHGVLAIGRLIACHLMLPHSQVSREHARIEVRGGQLLFTDLGSSNGSFLNGRRVRVPVELRMGDSIGIGPYELKISAEPEGESEKSAAPDTDKYPIFVGSLDQTPLSEILQGIEFHKKTGTLRVYSGEREGVLVVEDGKPLFARLGEYEDSAAVLKLLRIRSGGRFRFSVEKAPGVTSMQISITGLLLEASRQVDEDGKSLNQSTDWVKDRSKYKDS